MADTAGRHRGSGTDELPRGAVFGGAYSEDLVHWEQTGPVFRSDRDAYSIVEMPDLFELDGRWYLTFLEDNAYGNRDVLGEPELSCGTRYAVADRIEGPYVEPADNILLASRGFNGISCRTVLFRDRLHVTYTSCERELENETKPTFGVLSLPKELRTDRRAAAALLRRHRGRAGHRDLDRARRRTRAGRAPRDARVPRTVDPGVGTLGGRDRHRLGPAQLRADGERRDRERHAASRGRRGRRSAGTAGGQPRGGRAARCRAAAGVTLHGARGSR